MNLDTAKYLEPLRRIDNPRVQSSQVAPFSGGLGWRCVLLRELTPQENDSNAAGEGGGHAVYVDCIDFAGKRYLPAANKIRYGWEGMTVAEMPPLSPFEKDAPEPGGNVPIFMGQNLWVEIWDVAGHASDRVGGLSSAPTGHKSFYVVFQQVDEDSHQNGRTVEVSYDALLDIELGAKRLIAQIQALRGG